MHHLEKHTAPVLAVDLDGTLLKADLCWELLVVYLRPAPWRVVLVLAWTAGGGLVRLKARLADRVVIAGDWLPWNVEVVRWGEAQARDGKRVVLATASPQKSARAATAHFGFISDVLGSDEARNLKADAKADELIARFGREGFDYAGNSSADVPVWRAARAAFYVGDERKRIGFERKLGGKPLRAIAGGGARTGLQLLRTLRPHQWLKNLLVLVPLVAAHRWDDAECWRRIAPALLAVCCAASAAYVINDLADLAADRRHQRKNKRPFASGELGIPFGLSLVAGLLVAGLGLAWWSGAVATWATLGYFGFSVSYSLAVKKVPLADVAWLSGMYSYRVIIGGLIAGVMVSPWLLVYSTCLFLGLAFLKRYIELSAANFDVAGRVPGRGYIAGDRGWMKRAGVAASLASVAVLGFYLESPTSRALYAEPAWLWLVVLAMAGWLGRIWFMAGLKKVDDDPVWFAAKDPATWLAGGVCGAAMLLAGPLR